jgi:non-canonical poly(A) RNA polymerase PAPD5/7
MPDFSSQTNPFQRPREALDDPFKMRSLGTILFDFLYYYGSLYPHDDNMCMSISEGKILKSDSAETKKLGLDIRCPMSGGMYLHPCWILLSTLIRLSGNVAKSLGPRFLKNMVRSFKLCYTAILQSGATDRNILGPIVSVDQNVSDYIPVPPHFISNDLSRSR